MACSSPKCARVEVAQGGSPRNQGGAQVLPARSTLTAPPARAAATDVARELGLVIVGGSIPESSGGSLFNTCCVFNTKGMLLAKHRKVRQLLPYASAPSL